MIGLNLMSLRTWRTPLGRISVVIINPRKWRSLLRIERESIKTYFKRRDLNYPNIIIPRKVLNLMNRA
jgi:hypothetical protein